MVAHLPFEGFHTPRSFEKPPVRKSLQVALAAGLLVTALASFPARERTGAYQEPYRPQFHFSPETNWMNDPNGLVYDHGLYHLFYQYNPFGDEWGHMSWGHAVSRDMLHWETWPVALAEENAIMIFSGSAVVDRLNTSGFGTAGAPPLAAIYTGWGHDKQTQNIAYSTDHGRTWNKYAGNPVIDIHERDFRDPKVFWYEPRKEWIMVVSLAAQHRVRFYSSPNLKNWTALSDFGPAGAANPPNWECPDLYELPVVNEPGARKWVLEVGIGEHAAAGGSGGQYFIGDFDGRKFTNDNPASQVLWVDYGADFYAAQTWSDIPPSDGRRIMLGWMNDWRYAAKVPTHPWRGQMSLPRVVTLQRFPEGVRMVQIPVAELQQLRTKPFHLGPRSISGDDRIFDQRGIRGDTYEIQAEFELDSAKEFGFRLRKGPSDETLVGYDASAHEMFVDRTHSGDTRFSKDFPARHRAPLLPEKGIVRLHVFVDRCSVEVFGNDGRRVITDLVFPSPGSDHLELYARGGTVKLRSLNFWSLKSTWR